MDTGVVLVVVTAAVVLLAGFLVVRAVSAYNRLVRLREQVRLSWAQVDVVLNRRHSLIPHLVETVRGYAGHEWTTLDALTAARAAALGAADDARRRAGAEEAVTSALRRLYAVAEAYPRLRASANFAELQRELAATEDKIAYARQFHNTAVQALNTAVESLPTGIVARLAGFHVQPYLEAGGDERADVPVRF
ncbi:LemA family protein [Micromonospora sp. NBC_01699]|uniref:LemA family protein n=1 Tax=Micromonospora sp. NBC_01699 TaxID=2975984 RepID=UPI002E297735|nr:LemA family protein [Micromonospora sp. NBC_01699]